MNGQRANGQVLLTTVNHYIEAPASRRSSYGTSWQKSKRGSLRIRCLPYRFDVMDYVRWIIRTTSFIFLSDKMLKANTQCLILCLRVASQH